ncbi:hypothetical protein [Sphingobium agri]|uniref:Baseplate assembly protein n=1 Tax=Sphingobium agri TaxID=2933566 RepID=A0ABT0DWX2_9SPHN|nr:hypothetical protein [Sphingobium agri]MCK0531447.1 hypothetical protein [Sphingobium agri]
MTALPADIALAIRPAAIADASDAATKARFAGARDNLDSPSQGFFDSTADALDVLTTRFSLLGAVRRRFAVEVQDALLINIEQGVPNFRLVDDEQFVDGATLCARIEVDLENETTSMVLFG